MTRTAKMFVSLAALAAAPAYADLHVKDYGAFPNDGRDDTAALQAAFKALSEPDKRGPGGVLRFDGGLYETTDTVTASMVAGGVVRGAGGRAASGSGWDSNTAGTVIQCSSTENPAIRLDDCNSFRIDSIRIVAAATCIDYRSVTQGYGSGGLRLTHVSMRSSGVDSACFDAGRSGRPVTASDVSFDSCQFRGSIAFRSNHDQAVLYNFVACRFSWCGICFDVQKGGIISTLGCSTYSAGTWLRFGAEAGGTNTGANTFVATKFDGTSRRTCIVDGSECGSTIRVNIIDMQSTAGQPLSGGPGDEPHARFILGPRAIVTASGLHQMADATQGWLVLFVNRHEFTNAGLTVRDSFLPTDDEWIVHPLSATSRGFCLARGRDNWSATQAPKVDFDLDKAGAPISGSSNSAYIQSTEALRELSKYIDVIREIGGGK